MKLLKLFVVFLLKDTAASTNFWAWNPTHAVNYHLPNRYTLFLSNPFTPSGLFCNNFLGRSILSIYEGRLVSFYYYHVLQKFVYSDKQCFLFAYRLRGRQRRSDDMCRALEPLLYAYAIMTLFL